MICVFFCVNTYAKRLGKILCVCAALFCRDFDSVFRVRSVQFVKGFRIIIMLVFRVEHVENFNIFKFFIQ